MIRDLMWKMQKFMVNLNFSKLVKIMLEEDLKRWKMFLDGKTFPWDAPLYPSESKFITRLSNENTKSKTNQKLSNKKRK